MNIYLLENKFSFDDEYKSMIVIADSEQEAKLFHPNNSRYIYYNVGCWWTWSEGCLKQVLGWPTDLAKIKITKLGIAEENQNKGVIITKL